MKIILLLAFMQLVLAVEESEPNSSESSHSVKPILQEVPGEVHNLDSKQIIAEMVQSYLEKRNKTSPNEVKPILTEVPGEVHNLNSKQIIAEMIQSYLKERSETSPNQVKPILRKVSGKVYELGLDRKVIAEFLELLESKTFGFEGASSCRVKILKPKDDGGFNGCMIQFGSVTMALSKTDDPKLTAESCRQTCERLATGAIESSDTVTNKQMIEIPFGTIRKVAPEAESE